ncbi:MAG: ATP-binding protein [Vicinamibacteria bacterium]
MRDVETGRVRVHDPFELIRWLALSQPDPRKALAELVQNSLDAAARVIRVTRVRERGIPCLKILDDGEGIIPEMSRPEALRYIATHIGHSRKRSLSPQQRLELMTQGQYGIGLLGFWSLGERLEMRTYVPGQKPRRLILNRDRSQYVIEPIKGRLAFEERFTEVVVVGLHREAMTMLVTRRAADYLGAELRGQLLARDVDLVVEDKIARGRARRSVSVKPPRFLGERLEGLGPLEVPGYPPIRLEIYFTGDETNGAERHSLAVYAAGTLVCEGFHELAALGLDHPPWTDGRLTGLVDFPALRVAPGSRRGVVPDEAARAFVAALAKIERLLNELLEAREREQAQQLDRNLIRDLQRAFRDFYRHRPSYTMLPVRSSEDETSGPGDTGQGGVDDGDQASEGMAGPSESLLGAESAPIVDLFPPGPLATVEIRPSRILIECAGTKVARALAMDGERRAISSAVDFRWELSESIGVLHAIDGNPAKVQIVAGERPATGTLSVVARVGDREARASVPVEVLEDLGAGPADEGIPAPELVDNRGAGWRSRILDGRWQVNTGHRDYLAIADRPALKLRYLALLFAKEVVLRSSQDPRLEDPLEQLAEIAAYADRRITDRRSTRKKG